MTADIAEQPARARLSTIRHASVFDPARFDKTRVDVIGCGSVGSRIAMEVARLGVRTLHLWDFDTIEAHNIANQTFELRDVGRPKVDALADHIANATGLSAVTHNERVEGPVQLGKVVFLAVDSMAARKQIFKESLRLKITTDVVIETRMGVEELRVYGFNPRSRAEVEFWEASLYDDAPAVGNACRAQTTVGATAGMTACLAVTRFLQWYRRDFVRDPECSLIPALEQMVMLNPLTVITKGL
jgi:molybdopterin/thiamine biosynthesis adenylyltransferase